MTESFAELFEQSIASQRIRPGTILNGLIVEVGQDYVIVNVGLKSEAVIPSDQFKNEKGEIEVAVGETVEVALDSVEDGSGKPSVARESQACADLDPARKRLRETGSCHRHHHRPRQGRLHGRDRQRARVPARLFGRCAAGARSVVPREQTAGIQGHQLDQKRNNVVVSRRAVVEQEYSAERSALLDNLQEGAAVKGVVKNLTDYGAFVDLGGIDGLLHITDMAWKRVKHPSEVVKVGEEIDVRILKFDRERQRVSLGLKQLGLTRGRTSRGATRRTRVFSAR